MTQQTSSRPYPLAALLLLTANAAVGDVAVYKDWAIACDNTLHCEAVGYQPEAEFDAPVTLWLARDAGPDTPVTVRLMAVPPDGPDPASLSIEAGGISLNGLLPEADFPDPAQSRRLLEAMLDAPSATVTDGQRIWTLSLSGIKAALLRMDDLQGRLGTSGALVRKGSDAEANATAPQPAPRVQAAAIPATQPGDTALIDPILAAVEDRSCWEFLPDDEFVETGIHRLSADEVLVLRQCWRGPYQTSSAAWIANAKPPYAPRPVEFPTALGEAIVDVVNAEFADGEMFSYTKGRGVGDCIDTTTWQWTGTEFALIDAAETPLCRGIAGGGFPLRTWTAEVIR